MKVGNNIEIHDVPSLSSPIRLQEYGVGIFIAATTKSALKKVLKKGFVTVNDEVATSATFICGGENIRLSIPDEDYSKIKLVFQLRVIYEDEHLAIIHKPAGILVSGNSFKTISNALPQNIKRSVLKDAAKPQPIHRLDYATTGVLLVGKTSSSIRILNKLFEEKEINKTYYAITIGRMNSIGEITSEVDGKKSRSVYKVCGSVASKRFKRLNLVELVPKTGRRHQLRKHLSGIGNPILGDKKYGFDELVLKGKGMYLHAFSVEFNHPFTSERVYFESEFPRGFEKLFSKEVGNINLT